MPYYNESVSIQTFISGLGEKLTAYTDLWELVDDAIPGGICLKFVPEGKFVGIRITPSIPIVQAPQAGTGSTIRLWHGAGIQITFSETYDSTTKTFGGNSRHGVATLFQATPSGYTINASQQLTETTHYDIAYIVDQDGIYASISNNTPSVPNGEVRGVFFALEVPPQNAFEFNDGHGRLLFYTMANQNLTKLFDENQTIEYTGTPPIHWRYIRGTTGIWSNFYMIDEESRSATRGSSSRYAYFATPEVHGTAGLRDQLLRPKKWFRVQNGGGLSSGEIVSWVDNGVTRLYQISAANSTLGQPLALYAIAMDNIPMCP